MADWHCVTGAFGYSGSYIARALFAAGHRVRTLTNSPARQQDLPGPVDVHSLAFDDPTALRRALAGVRVLYNTYWVRFSRAGFSQADAVRNTRLLFDAARAAGVQRVIHVSITNPSLESPYEYFRGKAQLENALVATGLPHTILRPAVLFGGPDILVNNIAWMLRTFPVFGCFGRGRYRLQPIHVEDFAGLAVDAGTHTGDAVPNAVIDAIGPETFTYRELVRCIGDAIGRRRPVLPLPACAGLAAAKVLGWCVRDVLLTREEIAALMDGLLATGSPPTGTTRLSNWAREHGASLGRRYANELARRRDRLEAYAAL